MTRLVHNNPDSLPTLETQIIEIMDPPVLGRTQGTWEVQLGARSSSRDRRNNDNYRGVAVFRGVERERARERERELEILESLFYL